MTNGIAMTNIEFKSLLENCELRTINAIRDNNETSNNFLFTGMNSIDTRITKR